MLKKIDSKKVIKELDEKFKKNDDELLGQLERYLEKDFHPVLADDPSSLQANIKDKINALKEQNASLAEQISILEDIHQQMGIEKKQCPMCDAEFIAFLPHGVNPRANARCPNCGSLERHRLTYLFLKEKTGIFKDKAKFLHFAPEKIFYDIFRDQDNLDYLTVDINDKNSRVMEKMDIQDIQYPENTFDYIYCSHVLEHVPDDRKAIDELYRVLKPGGKAIILVPLRRSSDKTLEDPSYNTPQLRLKHYLQSDHLRLYGLDFTDRLEDAGFKILSDRAEFIKDKDEETVKRYGIDQYTAFFCCTKS